MFKRSPESGVCLGAPDCETPLTSRGARTDIRWCVCVCFGRHETREAAHNSGLPKIMHNSRPKFLRHPSQFGVPEKRVHVHVCWGTPKCEKLLTSRGALTDMRMGKFFVILAILVFGKFIC